MRLSQPFQRLNVRFDVARLREELARIPPSAWVPHPNGIPGNSSVRLISVRGAQNDDVNGPMSMTPLLMQSPYLRQILASFGVVWGRSRLMRLAPGATVPKHADINYHWFTRVRLHIPIVTYPEVRFHCGDQSVHMEAGEAWLFDNWRLHSVENPTGFERIHLVADTSGSSSFWQFVANSQSPAAKVVEFGYDPQRSTLVMTEHAELSPVMHPTEVETLARDLRTELTSTEADQAAAARLANYHQLLESFCQDWRQLYALYGTAEFGWSEFASLRDNLRTASQSLAQGLSMRTNRVAAHTVLEGRLLRSMLTSAAGASKSTGTPARVPPAQFRRPVFIVAAPRSGSTLLFETLATSRGLATVGGEAHWLVEDFDELRVGAPGVDSNRLSADRFSVELARRMHEMLATRLRDSSGRAVTPFEAHRLLEKTPKNALRIPLFNRVFPDAQFVFLWRDPRENLSSILEAWRSGLWQTYRELEGFEGPWSLLLPPGWRHLSGRPLEDIAAFQWESTNRIVLDDLSLLPANRWTVLEYSDLIGDPQASIERLCQFLDLEMDDDLRARLAGPLPFARYTHTPPSSGKWEMNREAIERVLPRVAATWERLKGFGRRDG
jgi:Sulfotransferase family/Aspartyl/Asparaginyl beta-hydroxylase